MTNEHNVVVRENEHAPYGQTITAGSHALSADEPVALGGKDSGPDPFELLLSALGACTAMTIRMYANRKGMALRHVDVRLSHQQRASQAMGLSDRFERVIVLEGELTTEQRRRLLEIADRCPVSQTLTKGAEITSMLASA